MKFSQQAYQPISGLARQVWRVPEQHGATRHSPIPNLHEVRKSLWHSQRLFAYGGKPAEVTSSPLLVTATRYSQAWILSISNVRIT